MEGEGMKQNLRILSRQASRAHFWRSCLPIVSLCFAAVAGPAQIAPKDILTTKDSDAIASLYHPVSATNNEKPAIYLWPHAPEGRFLAIITEYDRASVLWTSRDAAGDWKLLDAWEFAKSDSDALYTDFAPYRIKPGLTAVGMRLDRHQMLYGGGAMHTYLLLLSPEGDHLTPILTTLMSCSVLFTSGWTREGMAEKVDESQDSILVVENTSTHGYFDLAKQRKGRKGRMRFTWDGKRYISPNREIVGLKSWESGDPEEALVWAHTFGRAETKPLE